MALSHSPRIVTDGLVLCLDASNNKSIPKINILGTWGDSGGNQANYEILGAYSVKLKNTTTGWVGYFPATISSTGKYVITFTYYSDNDGSLLVLDNDGVMDNTYNTTLTANITPQTYTGSVDVTTTGNILHYFRRGSGGNIFVTNVSYFKLETTWTDLMGNGNTGTLTNGPTYNSSNGGSIVFDGIDDYVETGSISGISSSYNTSLEFFVNVTTNTKGPFVHLQSSTIDGYGIGIGNADYTENGSKLIMFSPFTATVNNLYTFPSSGWYHIVVTLGSDNFSWKLYVNGVKRSDFPSGTNSISSPLLKIGRVTSGGTTYYGTSSIAEVKVYNKALTASEIQQNFNALRGRYGI